MSRAETVSNQPYQLYGGPRIADFNTDQQSAFNMTRNLPGSYLPQMATAGGLTTLAALNSPSQYTAGSYTPGSMATPQTYTPERLSGIGSITPGVISPAGSYTPERLTNAGSYTPERISGPNSYTAGVLNSQDFDSAAATRYMNPYLSNVLDSQLARMNQRFAEQRLDRNSRAAKAGVFGGYRQGVEEAIAERDYNQQLNETENNALFQAYLDAQKQFNTDRTSRLGAEQFNINTARDQINQEAQRRMEAERLNAANAMAQFNTDRAAQMDVERTNAANAMAQFNADRGARTDIESRNIANTLAQANADRQAQMDVERLNAANAMAQFNADRGALMEAEKYNLDNQFRAFGANEDARQRQEQMRQSGLAGLLGASSQLFSQGVGTQDAQMRTIDALRQIGLQQQQLDQASLDLAHQDFADQNNYDWNQLNLLSSLLHGVPVQASTTVSQYENPNPYSQLLGLGINGLALSNALRGGG